MTHEDLMANVLSSAIEAVQNGAEIETVVAEGVACLREADTDGDNTDVWNAFTSGNYATQR
jgi:hypothetical protein